MSEFSRTLKLVTVWLVVGAAVFVGVQGLEHSRSRMQFQAADGVIEIRRAPDGHFHWPGSVNGVAVDFLIDTGATTTALPKEVAERAALRSRGSTRSSTAGGIVRGELAIADITLQGGVSAENVRVTVLPGLGAPLLGMDMLSRLRWSQEGGVLRFKGEASAD
jgi:aspartyl protease family protein